MKKSMMIGFRDEFYVHLMRMDHFGSLLLSNE